MLDEISTWIDKPATVRVSALLLACILSGVWANSLIESVDYKKVVPSCSTEAERRVADQFITQSSNLETWALALLGFITAIIVTTRVHRLKHAEIAFALLGPALVILLFSLRAARLARMRLTNLYAYDNLHDLVSVGSMLLQQWSLFFAGLGLAALFTGTFLISIVAGTVKPYDEHK